jgi:hypothetical protein
MLQDSIMARRRLVSNTVSTGLRNLFIAGHKGPFQVRALESLLEPAFTKLTSLHIVLQSGLPDDYLSRLGEKLTELEKLNVCPRGDV